MNQKQSDFDHWIRRLADEAESPFHETSWFKMEELMDSRRKKRVFWWMWPLGITGTILLFGFMYFFIKPNKNVYYNDVNNITNTRIQAEKNYTTYQSPKSILYSIKATVKNAFVNTSGEAGINVINLNAENSYSQSKSSINSGQNNASVVSSAVQTAKINFSLKKDSPSNQGAGVHQSTIDNQKNEKNINSKSDSGRAISLNNPDPWKESIKDKKLDDTSNDNSAYSMVTAKTRRPLIVHVLSYNWSLLPGPSHELKLPSVLNSFKIPKSKLYTAIVLSIQASPEITTVPGRSYGSISKEYGFNISYQFTPHLSITTGLQKTNKKYSAHQGDYEILNGDYLYGKVIENIDGICKVVEWPITVGYKFRALGNNYFQVNAGLSSLKMDKENYGVDYSYWKGGKVNHKVYDFATKNWEMWSAAVFSLSYIKPISKHWSVSLNPYLQTPLKGIGAGKVDLKSVGSRIGINYNIPTSRKN